MLSAFVLYFLATTMEEVKINKKKLEKVSNFYSLGVVA